jgi:glucosamine 6-phosphate synthetase-like amidotransferase/phosphosugar isomerase protein
MVTLLDCIERVPSVLENILRRRQENFNPLFDTLGKGVYDLDEIVFIGSGTSNTSAVTSKIFVEKAGGIKVSVVFPNDFCHNTYYYNPKALYVFTSQTGNSIVSRQAQRMMRDKGCQTVSVTESKETPIARESAVHIDMGCGKEEYPTRVIGYCASVFTHMLLGLEIGLRRGNVTLEQYNAYISAAAAVPGSHRVITPNALKWFEKVKRRMLRSGCILFTGADALQGVA